MRNLWPILILGIFFTLVHSPIGWAHPGSGIVVDHRGHVYFADVQCNCVWKIDTQNKLISFVKGKHTHHLSIDSSGNLYGEYGDGNGWISLWKATPEGKLIDPFIPYQIKGYGFTMDQSANIYSWIANVHAKRDAFVFKTSSKGTRTTLAGSTWGLLDGKRSNAKFSSIGGIALGQNGALYLTDGKSVRKVTRDGTVSTLATNLEEKIPADGSIAGGLFNYLMGLTVDGKGNVYAADYGGRRVLRITPTGTVETAARSESPWSPTGVASTPGGVYFLEYAWMPSRVFNLRVRKLSPSGEVTSVAVVE